MKLEKIKEIIKSFYNTVNYAEDVDYEQAYINNNITQIKNLLKSGKIDPEILTEEMLIDFLNDGVDLKEYEEFAKTYAKSDRESFIQNLKSENIPDIKKLTENNYENNEIEDKSDQR